MEYSATAENTAALDEPSRKTIKTDYMRKKSYKAVYKV